MCTLYVKFVSPPIGTDADPVPTASLYLYMEKKETRSKKDVSTCQSLSCSPPVCCVLSLKIVVPGVQD